MTVKIKKLTNTATTPTYGSAGAAAFDIYADIGEPGDKWLVAAEGVCAVPTGLAFEVPLGHVLRIYSRSGHGFKNEVSLVNSVGVIDSDYRGEVKIGLRNDRKFNSFTINHGDRIAQGIIEPIERVIFEVVEELSTTERGAGGFGSTGA